MKTSTAVGVAARTVLVAAVLALPLAISTATATAAPAPKLKGRLLTVADLPAGWHTSRTGATRLDLARTPCLRGLGSRSTGSQRTTASFAQGSGIPALAEAMGSGVTSAQLHNALDALAKCRTLTLTIDRKKVKATISKTELDLHRANARAFSLVLTATQVPFGADVVVFRTNKVVGELFYLAVGTPTRESARSLAALAISKAQGHRISPPATPTVVAARVQTTHTKKGTVGFREVGSGPPLVMIMGFAGTMETWDPRLIDALAHHYRVVIFDNAGSGRTGALPAPLTIDAMADQTSALISSLRLRRPDVLGWSMGSMVAEALAVRHPSQVNRLVLCAAYPGTGTVEPSQKAVHALIDGSPAQALAVLFPPDQPGAGIGYEVSLSGWPKSPGVPAGVVDAQKKAITRWWSGDDRAGKRTSTIARPTLVVDGASDRLDPQANSRRLQKLIAGAQLTFFPDAGHAFLFQSEPVVVQRIETFLGG
ncbi:MAG: alpha/beta fold hydrolase [Acidimicrobiales bacterium]